MLDLHLFSLEKLRGYRIKSTNINRINRILQAAKTNIQMAANEEFHRLLCEEITELVDNIALGIVERPQDRTILQAALDRLMDKVRFAEGNNLSMEYNLRTAIQIFPDKDATYFLFFGNVIFEEAFAMTQGIEDYTVEIEVSDTTETVLSEKAVVWNRLQSEYKDNPSILCGNFNLNLNIDESLLIFPDVKDRAEERARQNLTSRYMNMYSLGRQIDPQDLMPVMDRALIRLMDDESKEQLDIMTAQLRQILPEITLDMIRPAPEGKDPEEEPPSEEK